MPSRKEIQWAQLRVGLLVLAGIAVLVGLIFLMSSTSGGVFARKLTLRCYFENAAGLKNGAPVTLEGVTIGNVVKVRVVPERAPYAVEATMRVGSQYLSGLHVDSTATIAQAGVLGDSYIDINSAHAHGPVPASNTELKASGSPSIQDVIRTSNDSIAEVQGLIKKLDTLVDSINSGQGTLGQLATNREMGQKFVSVANNLELITRTMAEGKGTLGKLATDDTLYNRANAAVDRLDRITTALDNGQGSMGKLLKDESFYDNLNAAVKNTNQLVGEINAGHGAAGMMLKDPVFAARLNETVTRLDSILTSVDQGKGTLGQLVQNPSLYQHADQTLVGTGELVQAIRDDPKKYLVIRLKLF